MIVHFYFQTYHYAESLDLLLHESHLRKLVFKMATKYDLRNIFAIFILLAIGKYKKDRIRYSILSVSVRFRKGLFNSAFNIILFINFV